MSALPVRSSLRGQLLLVVLGALGPALVFVLWGANRERNRALAASEAEGHRLLSLLSRTQQASLGVTRQLLEGTAGLLEERGGLPDPVHCSSSVARLRRVEPRYASVLIAAVDGRVLCSSPEGFGEVSLADRPYFQKALETGGFAMGAFQIGKLSGKPTVAFAQPVRDPGGRVVSVAVASIDLDWLAEALEQAPPPPGTTLCFLDRNGTILAQHPDGTWPPGSTFALAPRLLELSERRRAAEGPPGTAGVKVWWQVERLAGDAGSTAGYLAMGLPAEILFAGATRALVRQLFALALVAIVALAGVWFFAEALVVNRLEKLAAAARRLGEGDLSARSALPKGGGEMGALARTFDGMAESLERRAVERERAEAELRRSENALRALTERLDGIREEEGTRIARELHDEVGQALTGLKLDLAALKRALPEESGTEAADRIAGMASLADATIERVRRISGELRPQLLDQLGLVSAVEAYLERFGARTRVTTRLEAALDEEGLDRRRASALFRILQEALTNVARHAAASSVTVRLAADGGDVVLTVADDGRGLSASAGPALGILGMQERARAAGGRVTVEGAPGRGTVVTARLSGAAGPASPRTGPA
jgi:signal transduction histidine kinase